MWRGSEPAWGDRTGDAEQSIVQPGARDGGRADARGVAGKTVLRHIDKDGLETTSSGWMPSEFLSGQDKIWCLRTAIRDRALQPGGDLPRDHDVERYLIEHAPDWAPVRRAS